MSEVKRWGLLVGTVVLGAIVNLAGTVIFVVTGTQAREHNCDQSREAMHVLVVELGASFGRGPDDPEVVDLDARTQDRLKDCR